MEVEVERVKLGAEEAVEVKVPEEDTDGKISRRPPGISRTPEVPGEAGEAGEPTTAAAASVHTKKFLTHMLCDDYILLFVGFFNYIGKRLFFFLKGLT